MNADVGDWRAEKEKQTVLWSSAVSGFMEVSQHHTAKKM